MNKEGRHRCNRSLDLISLLSAYANDSDLTMTEMYSTIVGISDGRLASSGPTNCATAPPKGFARLITAVAATRPLFENHRSEYLVGAARTNG